MTKTVWITKWALTQGIIKADDCEITARGYATREVTHMSSPRYVFARMGTDAFESEAEAKANTLIRIHRRLKALDKEKAKLETLAAMLVV